MLRKKYYSEHAEEQRSQKRIWREDFKQKDPEGYKKQCSLNYKRHIAKAKKENPDALRKKRTETTRRYVNKNREKHRKYCRDLYRNNTGYRITVLLRKRIKIALKSKRKLMKTTDLIGCSIDFLKNHLQQTAFNNGYKDFNINNYDSQKYHIDHITPCASFDLTDLESQKICFNYKNLQILEESDCSHD